MTLPKKWIKPKHGIVLAGIPTAGAEVEGRLAKEWIDNGLVEAIDSPAKQDAQASLARLDEEERKG